MRPHTSAALFGAEPSAGSSLTAVLGQRKPASKAEKTFQQLIARIETKREQLLHWQAYLPRHNQRVIDDIEPLQARLREGQRKMVDVIDELLSRPRHAMRLTRLERTKLAQLLTDIAGGLLDESGDAVLEGLFDKHSEVSYRQIERSRMEMTESMLSDVFGLDLDDEHGAASTEELLALAQRKVAARVEQEQRLAELHQENETRPAGRSKGSVGSAAKASAAAARREAAAKQVSQSLRDVYRKLVSALHPDREPDALERQRKTLLMQRVNQAYDGNDLLTLLGLQLEIEQIDAGHMASLTPQRLAHYNQILREQLAELEAELARSVEPFIGIVRSAFNITPDRLDRAMNGEIARIKTQIKALLHDLTAFREPDYLRASLKHYQLEDDVEDVDDLAGLFDVFAPTQAKRAGKKRQRK